MPDFAPILTLEEFKVIRPSLEGKTIVTTSGGYDPIHPGHISSIMESKKYGDILVVIVNGDWFLENKKGKPFQDLLTRCQIVAGIRGVDYVISFEIENDSTVCEALKSINPEIFTKGGDRISTNTPEYELCKQLKIKMIEGVGLPKYWSSTDFLKNWHTFCSNKP